MAEMVTMAVPKGWVVKTLRRTRSNKEELLEFNKFAERHSYNKKLLKFLLKMRFNHAVGERT